MSTGLRAYLNPKLTPASAANHRLHAVASQRHLEALIDWDLNNLVVDAQGTRRFTSIDDFRFFLACGHETTDLYSRILCILKPDEPVAPPGGRAESYNLRMVKSGWALPYVIWPNIEPWKKQRNLLAAVFAPADVPDLLHDPVTGQATTLETVRQAVAIAQNPANPQGAFAPIYDNNGNKLADPLALLPHEIRFLSGRRPPWRSVIDLSQSAQFAGKLVDPQDYWRINIEDRLYIPAEYVPLFEAKGWQQLPLLPYP
jgi:hypothetical protein